MKRPFSVTLAGMLVLILALWNALRAWTSLAWRSILNEYSVQMPPFFSAGMGSFWFIIGLTIAASIWKKNPWSIKLLSLAAIGYTIWYWSERMIWQNPRPNVPFAIIINLACLVTIYFASKSLSREAYERDIENPATE